MKKQYGELSGRMSSKLWNFCCVKFETVQWTCSRTRLVCKALHGCQAKLGLQVFQERKFLTKSAFFVVFKRLLFKN
jgi:hypothetical protein